MKNRKKQATAAAMAAALAITATAASSPAIVYAQETENMQTEAEMAPEATKAGDSAEETTETETSEIQTETATPQTETAAAQTETEALQTETPAVQTETEALQTETTAAQTETEASQTETAVPQTETAEIQTETPASQTEEEIVQEGGDIPADGESTRKRMSNGTEQQNARTTPTYTTPTGLTAAVGQILNDISLPEGFDWEDGEQTVGATGTNTFTVSYTPKDTVTYDTVKGIAVTVDVQGIAVNARNFPDEVFRTEVISAQDTDRDGILSEKEIKAVYRLGTGNPEVLSAEGIQYFPNLQLLGLANTSVSELDVSKNSQLYNLDCTNTKITSLDVSSNPKLSTLNCFNNEGLTSLNLKGAVKLENLNCMNTGLTSLDLSENTALKTLVCHSLKINSLDISNNPDLTHLQCRYIPTLTEINIGANSKLNTIEVMGTGISSLDVSNAPELKILRCSDTKLESLDVSNNPLLQQLSSSNTELKSIDTSANSELTHLGLSSTHITSLDVSQNPKLIQLGCNNTLLSSLDVSGCSSLAELYCTSPNLAWVNFGEKSSLGTVSLSSTGKINVTITGPSFNIEEAIPGIDAARVTNMSGAVLEGKNVSGYSAGTPVKYEYICGNSSTGEKRLTVTLNLLKQDNTITIGKDLDMVYSGNPVELTKDDCTVAVSTGDIAFTYYQMSAAGMWEKLAHEPKDAGTYKVEAKAAGTEYFNEAIAEKEFTISQAENEWTEELSIKGWTYGDYDSTANGPGASAKFGEPVFIYSNEENGTYTDVIPETAGVWYVKAEVAETENYAGLLSAVQSFTIEKATPVYTAPDNLFATIGQTLNDITLPDGFAWEDGAQSVGEMGTHTFNISFTPGDTDNYESITGISVSVTVGIAINKINFPDDAFRDIISSSNYDKDGNSVLSKDEIDGITSIQIAGNDDIKDLEGIKYFTNLNYLDCYKTSITALDVSKNTSLKWLYCNNTGITSLDVSENISLQWLYCDNTGITSLDVSKNTRLERLNCGNTGIISLDVSQNTRLQILDCSNTNLVWLDIGSNDTLYAVSKPEEITINNITLSGPSFDLTVLDAQISAGKVSAISGGTLEGLTATVDSVDTPFVYEYACGTSKDGKEEILTVRVNFVRGSSTIEIKEIPDRPYTGQTVPLTKADCEVSGSSGEVTFTYYGQSADGTWKELDLAPANAGLYKVMAELAQDNYHSSAESEEKEFQILQADNSWTTPLAITGWTYGEYDPAVNAPGAAAKFGDAAYTYSKEKGGTYTDSIPKTAGIWYVKAMVPGAENYKGLEEVKEFTVSKAAAPEVRLPENLSAVQDDALSTVALPRGWVWVDGTQTVSVGNTGYAVRLSVDDANYDYTETQGYSAQGHYVERVLDVFASQGGNAWSTSPSIAGWTYGETPGTPAGSAEHGTAVFTYSSSETGEFKDEIPSAAGTWYMKASVPASAEYKGLNEVVAFIIRKAVPVYEVPSGLTASYGQTLEDVLLPDGFAWEDGTLPVGSAGEHSFKAAFTPEDTDNYETVSEIAVKVDVVQAENEWTEELSIKGWTYGSYDAKVNAPRASAKYGDISYAYSDAADGDYTDELPTAAGTWYVKAAAAGTADFTGIESAPVPFEISPKDSSGLAIPDISPETGLDGMEIRDGDILLVPGRDYDVTKEQNGNTVTVTVTFKGSRTGKITKTYKAADTEDSNKTPETEGSKKQPETEGSKKASETSGTGGSGTTVSTSVKTADTSSPGLWGAILALSGVLLAILAGKRKRKETKEDH